VNGKRWAALGIAVALLIFSIVTNAFSAFFSKDFQATMDGIMNPTSGTVMEEVIEDGNLMKKIAVLDVFKILVRLRLFFQRGVITIKLFLKV